VTRRRRITGIRRLSPIPLHLGTIPSSPSASQPPPPVRPHDPRLVSTCCLSVPSACEGFAHHECPRRVCPCFGWVHVPWHGLSPSHVSVVVYSFLGTF
jgi:hypothetical protein